MMKSRTIVCMLSLSKYVVPLLILVALQVVAGLLIHPTSTVHAATVDPPCLVVRGNIIPNRTIIPLDEVLSVTVTNGCGETVQAIQLSITDHIRCATGVWGVDLQTTVGQKMLAPKGGLFWWITRYQTSCPPGETGLFQQWLHGEAEGIGARTGNLDTGQGDGYLNGPPVSW